VNRVLVIEDDPYARATIASLVDTMPGYGCEVAASYTMAKQMLEQSDYDLLLVDLDLGDGSGLELISMAKTQSDAKCMVISVFGDRQSVLRATEEGVDGYLIKDASVEEIAIAIEQVASGLAPISPSVAAHLLRELRGPQAPTQQTEVHKLTPREKEVLEQLARGYTYREVAEACAISVHTVSFHLKQIYAKLSVNSRGEAIYKALNSGLLKVS